MIRRLVLKSPIWKDRWELVHNKGLTLSMRYFQIYFHFQQRAV